MQPDREHDPGFGNGFGGGGFGGGGFGGNNFNVEENGEDWRDWQWRDWRGSDVEHKTYRWDGRDLTRRELRELEEFEPEFTDEKRNEWLKWIDERSKQYSIEPVIINRFSKDDFDYHPDIILYSTAYGTLEVQEQFVENYVTKPVESIMKARGLRYPLVIDGPRYDYHSPNSIHRPTDPPTKKYDLMDLFVNQKLDYTEFCKDLYENYQEMDRGYTEFAETHETYIWFDELTDELCFNLRYWEPKCKDVKTSGMNLYSFIAILSNQ